MVMGSSRDVLCEKCGRWGIKSEGCVIDPFEEDVCDHCKYGTPRKDSDEKEDDRTRF